MQPDYRGGGIVNLMSSLRRVLGAPDNDYPVLAPVDLIERLGDRSVVLLVIDGLGFNHLRDGDKARSLNQHLACSLTSVFPSTTASAITTYLTGLAPQQHGLVGWHTYFKEIDSVFTPLPFVPRDPAETPSPNLTPASLFDHTPLFEQLDLPTHSVSPAAIAHSPFNRFHCAPATIHPYQTVPELFETLATICQRARQQQFTYAYYPAIDFLSHLHGSMSAEVASDLKALDHRFERFLEEIDGTDTTVLVTADHGFVDPSPEQKIDLADYPEIARALAKPLCGEPRVAYCYVKSGQEERFETLVAAQLGGKVRLFPSEQLVQDEYFGLGAAHPGLADRTGDFTLVMESEHMLKDWLPGEKRFDFQGVHGGVSETEMLVPLCIAEV